MLWCDFLVGEGILDGERFAAANRDLARRGEQGAVDPAEFTAFYASTLGGRSAAAWAPLRDRFIAERVVPRLGARSHALVAGHRDQGDRVVLTTATNRFLTEPIAARLGIADLIATELEVDAGGAFTGRTAGMLNMREGKPDRLAAWLAGQGLEPASIAAATFYSDSINDLPLLSAVGTAIVVDADARLAAEARRRGWAALSLVG